MCYDVKTKLETLLKRAIRYHDEVGMMQIREELKPYITDLHHVSGFSHPTFLIYPSSRPSSPILSKWGLIPHWVKNNQQAFQLWNKTINARGESIFEKPSFREAAISKRCIVYLDGFYEHHHFKGKSYPFFIQRKNMKPMAVAGLWSEWADKESGELINTFTIVTTKANQLMKIIHNNPKLPESRMPLILSESLEDDWLKDISNKDDQEFLKQLIQPYPTGELQAYSVQKLRGKSAFGNVPEASEEFIYAELEIDLP